MHEAGGLGTPRSTSGRPRCEARTRDSVMDGLPFRLLARARPARVSGAQARSQARKLGRPECCARRWHLEGRPWSTHGPAPTGSRCERQAQQHGRPPSRRQRLVAELVAVSAWPLCLAHLATPPSFAPSGLAICRRAPLAAAFFLMTNKCEQSLIRARARDLHPAHAAH